MTVWRECGKCHELWPIDAVKCVPCNTLLVMTAGDRVNARVFGGRRVWEAPSGRAKVKPPIYSGTAPAPPEPLVPPWAKGAA